MSPARGASDPATDAPWRALPRRSAPKASHLLAADLRRRILTGELAEDQQLPPEAELVAVLHVSRDTLREALRILESQSLLEIRRGRGGGAVVRRPGLDAVGRYVALLLQLRRTTLADLEEARAVIEPPAAELVAIRAGDDGLDRLAALHDAERRAERDPLAFATAVAAFDQAVTELSGNRSLAVIAGVFRDIYAGQVFSALGGTDRASAEQLARKVVSGHGAFLDAVRRRDGALAATTWRDHLGTTGPLLVSRNRSRQPMDVTPLWRARADSTEDQPPRRAMAVATEIRARIAEGRLREGDRLPPLADLSAEFGISRPTLREALRILEMELLLDLRTGDRGGATIRTPSSKVAAQQAGVVLESRRATLADFSRALTLIEPPIMEVVAARMAATPLKLLRALEGDLGRVVDDTERFVRTWRESEIEAFSQTGNPALTVIAELLHWVRFGVEPAVLAEASTLPWDAASNRRTHALFAEFVSAAERRDPARAREAWAALLDANASFVEGSALGDRLMIDLMG